MRIVIDTNVLVSSVLKAGTPPAQVVERWQRDRLELITTQHLLDELTSVLGRARLQRRIASPRLVSELLAQLNDRARLVEPTETIDLSDDSDDNRVLEAAVAGQADYIITGDDDLLRLREVRGTRIRTPAQFLIELAARDEPPT